MGKKNRRLYHDLAWLFPIISPPEDYIEETKFYFQWIKQFSKIPVRTLLHLGCGAGHNDFLLKKHFDVTGVDLSPSMLKLARQLNPENVYQQGDMRDVRLGKQFDTVVCLDSIDYLVSESEIRSTMMTAWHHLKPGGVFFTLVEQLREKFMQNKTVCTMHQKDNIDVAFVENYYDPDPEDTTFEAVMVYMIRENGKFAVEADHHLCGLFNENTWNVLFEEAGFECVREELILSGHPDEIYPVFIGIKPLTA
jgi:SAM-dependent methyltransferase